MKRQIFAGLLFCVLLSFLSCAATMSMLIDVEKPAAVTLPVKAQNVIIVNNAVPQPMGYGVSAPSGKFPDIDSLYIKTLKAAPWEAAAEAFRNLNESKFFSDVSIYKKGLRGDDEWLYVVLVDDEIREDFFENQNFDMLISIDRLFFSSTIDKNKPELGRMEAALTFSAYLRGEDEPVIHTLNDTLKAYPTETAFYNGLSSIQPEEINTEMIHQTALDLGEKLGMYFAPSWQTFERIYFVRNAFDANRTSNFINTGTWLQAKNVWTDEFELEKKAINKARLATNIALACEMNGDFYEGVEWASKAIPLFQNASSKKYAGEIKYLQVYIKELQERQKNNLILDKQHGIS